MNIQGGKYVPLLALLCNLTVFAMDAQVQQVVDGQSVAYQGQAPELQEKLRNWRFKEKRLAKSRVSTADVGCFFSDLLKDVLCLHRNLFDWDSFKVLAGVFPFFIFSRMVDERLQSIFHEYSLHKNSNQFPSWCHDAGKYGLGVEITLLGLNAFVSRNEDLRQTSRVFLLGMPFLIFAKDLIKEFEWSFSKRPWNDRFNCEKRAHGGFPSGHIAEATYTAVLYGMRYGLIAGVPLGLVAGGIGITFLNCNRHYLSQLVAGAGLGTMYAIAANKLIDTRLSENLELAFSVNASGGAALGLAYHF